MGDACDRGDPLSGGLERAQADVGAAARARIEALALAPQQDKAPVSDEDRCGGLGPRTNGCAKAVEEAVREPVSAQPPYER